jgi:hypothetical protein
LSALSTKKRRFQLRRTLPRLKRKPRKSHDNIVDAIGKIVGAVVDAALFDESSSVTELPSSPSSSSSAASASSLTYDGTLLLLFADTSSDDVDACLFDAATAAAVAAAKAAASGLLLLGEGANRAQLHLDLVLHRNVEADAGGLDEILADLALEARDDERVEALEVGEAERAANSAADVKLALGLGSEGETEQRVRTGGNDERHRTAQRGETHSETSRNASRRLAKGQLEAEDECDGELSAARVVAVERRRIAPSGMRGGAKGTHDGALGTHGEILANDRFDTTGKRRTARDRFGEQVRQTRLVVRSEQLRL